MIESPQTHEEIKRAQVLELCDAAAAARVTGNQLVIYWVNVGIKDSIRMIIPDLPPKPSLQDFLPASP